MVTSLFQSLRDLAPKSLLDVAKGATSIGKATVATVGVVSVGLIAGGAVSLGAGVALGLAGAAAAGKATQIIIRDGLSYCLLRAYGEDPILVQEVIEISPKNAQYIPDYLKEQASFMSDVVKANPRAFKYADETLRNDKEFVETTTKLAPDTLQYAADSVKKDHAFMKKMVLENISNLKYVHADLLNSPPFIEELILAEGQTNENVVKILNKAGKAVLKDQPAMIAIAEVFPKEAFQKADGSLHKSPQFMLPILLDDVTILHRAQAEILANVELMTAIAEKNPEVALRAANTTLKKNAAFMLPIAKHKPFVLIGKDARALRANPNFMGQLCSSNITALKYAADTVIQDEGAMIAIAKKHPKEAYKAVCEKAPELKGSAAFMAIILKDDPTVLKDPSFSKSPLLKDENFLKTIVLNNPETLEILSKTKHLDDAYISLTENTNYMIEIAKEHPKGALAHAEGLNNDRGFLLAVAIKEPSLLPEVQAHFKKEEERFTFIQDCIRANPKAAEYIPNTKPRTDRLPGLTAYEKLILKLLKTEGPEFFSHITSTLFKDRNFMKEAVQVNPEVFIYADSKLREDKEFIKHLFALNPKETLTSTQRRIVFHSIDCKLKKDEVFLASIKHIPGVRMGILTDDDCKEIIIKNREFFTREELKEMITIEPRLIQCLALDSSKDRLLIIELVSEVPEAIQYINQLQETPGRATSIIKAICKNNLNVLLVLRDLDSTSFLRNDSYERLLTDRGFFSTMKTNKGTFFKTQPDILEFVTEELLGIDPNIVLEIIRSRGTADSLKFLGESVKKDRDLFTRLANSEFGNEVYDYADDSIRQKRSKLLPIGPKYEAAPVPVAQPAVVQPVVPAAQTTVAQPVAQPATVAQPVAQPAAAVPAVEQPAAQEQVRWKHRFWR